MDLKFHEKNAKKLKSSGGCESGAPSIREISTPDDFFIMFENNHVPPNEIRIPTTVLERFKELNLCSDPRKWPYEDRDEWELFLEQGYVMIKETTLNLNKWASIGIS